MHLWVIQLLPFISEVHSLITCSSSLSNVFVTSHAGEAYSVCPDSLPGFEGPTSKGEEGMGMEGDRGCGGSRRCRGLVRNHVRNLEKYPA